MSGHDFGRVWELGHCLGLALSGWSLLYMPFVSDDTNGVDPLCCAGRYRDPESGSKSSELES